MKAIAVKLGKRIRLLRKERSMTQEELGEKADIHYKFLGSIERGNANPSLDSLDRISRALSVPIIDLFPSKGSTIDRLTPDDLKLIKKAAHLIGEKL